MKLWTYLFGRGFTGGPDFALDRAHRFDLDGITLEFSVPTSNMVFAEEPKQVNFPFRSPGWFEVNCQQLWNHFYVPVYSRLWAYVGPYWKVMNEPFGVLSVGFDIKRTLPGKVLDLHDLNTLADAIRWDYEEYFEAEEPGKYHRGRNRQIREEALATYSKPHWQNPMGQEQMALHIKNWSHETPRHFEPRRYGEQCWLYYSLEREPNYPARYYCHPLDEHYYLCVRFGYDVDFSKYFHLWKPHAEAAEQRIIQTVRLTFPQHLSTPELAPTADEQRGAEK